jgi:dUTP pyrophosphatase
MSFNFDVKLMKPNAIFPTKAHSTDIGYDLTIIEEVERYSESTAMYDTGISIQPHNASMYAEIVPRSSFGKTGYILSNSVGIIDPEYTGTLKVILTKVDPSLPNLSLPYKGFQLIARRAERPVFVPVLDESEIRKTKRGNGGFGSTNLSQDF